MGFFVCQTLNNKGGNKEEFLALLLVYLATEKKRKEVKKIKTQAERIFKVGN